MDPELSRPNPSQIPKVDHLLEHFEQLEAVFEQVRKGLAHSHRLTTLGMITAVIAHEYNNILTPVISYGELALDRDDSVLMKKAVEKAIAGAKRASDISTSLLGFGCDHDGEDHAALLPLTVSKAIKCLVRDPRKDRIEILVDVPEIYLGIGAVNLQQVLVNLILNAKKAMHESGGTIHITGRREGEMGHLEVSDTGPGIDAEVFDQIFEPFVTCRVDPQKDHKQMQGTGLGLCICHDLIRTAGGTITVANQSGKGAVFHIQLPIVDELIADT